MAAADTSLVQLAAEAANAADLQQCFDKLNVDSKLFAINLKAIEGAHAKIKDFIHETPVVTSQQLDAISGLQLYFKLEALQRTGSFKASAGTNCSLASERHTKTVQVRGAMNAVLSLSTEEASKGVVTHSSGNHAQALALAAKTRGIPANIVMPSDAPQVKKDAVAGYGATITQCAPTNEARNTAAAALQHELGSHFVHPSNDPAVMAGQGTMALELLQQIPAMLQQQATRAAAQAAALQALGVALPPPNPPAHPSDAPVVDAVVVPLGGGGMLSGVTIAIKSIDPRILVIAGEPAGAADAAASVQRGQLTGHEQPPCTVADGLRTTLGSNTWPIVQHAIDGIITMTDAEILLGMELLWTRLKIAAEPSAGVGVATVLSPAFKKRFPQAKRVAVIVCGGNVDVGEFPLGPLDGSTVGGYSTSQA